jgi:hypothetical protein
LPDTVIAGIREEAIAARSGNIRAGSNSRERRSGAHREAERAHNEIHDAPQGEDDDEADDAPKYELFARRALGFVVCTVNEIFVDAPEEDDEGDSYQHRHENSIDEIGDTA